MAVKTKSIKNRRQVRYDSYEELLADAEKLADAETVGNWSPGQIYAHLAKSFNGSIDGMGFALPAPVRLMMSVLMKKKCLTQEIPAGFKTKSHLQPAEVSSADGLQALRTAVDRLKQEERRASHPMFGEITRSEWDQFNLRHAEMHMSFLKEAGRKDAGSSSETRTSSEPVR